MKRREFLKLSVTPVALSLATVGCGIEESSKLSLTERFRRLDLKEIWAYYVPLSRYDGLLDDYQGRHELDRKVILSEVQKRTQRINGARTDGTKNRASFTIEALESSEEFIRVKFWHDDSLEHERGHTLYFFKRHIETLESGEKLFVATGMTQNHFHIAMVEPKTLA